MRMTIHNGRAGKNGTYSPKHNDRNFDISSAEHIDPERMPGNVYWNWTGKKDISFEDCEKAFYEEHCRAHLDAVNQRHREQRHPERVRDMDAYRTARQTCPEETLFMIGNQDEHLPPKTLRAICERLKDWEENTVSGLKVLDFALHVDEQGAPHIHMRRAWIYRDENNVESISQSKALQAAGIPLPHPDKPAGRTLLAQRLKKCTYILTPGGLTDKQRLSSELVRQSFYLSCGVVCGRLGGALRHSP